MENNLIGLLLILIFGGAGLIAIFTVVNLLLPQPIERARNLLETSIFRSFLIGLVNSILAGALGILVLLPARGGGPFVGLFVFLAGLIGITTIALTILGLVALTTLLGARIGGTVSPVASHVRGAAVLVLACLTPFLGWFVITPLTLWVGLGAGVHTLLRKKETPAPAA